MVDGLKSFGIKGVEIALEGHQVLCPVCQTAGAIVCVDPRLKMEAHGRNVALSDDLCLCKCDPAPRLIANQLEWYQTITREDTSVHSKAAPVSPPLQAPATMPRTTSTSASRPTTPAFSEMLESSCERNWRFYQQQAEDIVAPGGTLIADPRQRNRVINSAYAQLWRLDNRFQWAGLAAFASKQVGCGLLHAAEAIEKIQVEYEAAQQLRRSARVSWRQGGLGLIVAILLVWVTIRLGSDDPEIALRLGEPWEDMRQRSSANIGPAIPGQYWGTLPRSDARLRFIDSQYGFITPTARFFMIRYDDMRVADLSMSPQTEPLQLDDTIKVMLDLQEQWRKGGWVPIRVEYDPPFVDTPEWRARLRDVYQGATSYWQAGEKYQLMMVVNRFKDDRYPNEERYLIKLSLGKPWVHP